ncbi:gamma carbonic anhydrase family protein [Clostridium zeae]|uniref:Gamma carbonic anhydrase family protein n=1 Tax=Clostridium zeae TaxID=2759022 RepID=A0ABQ1EA63_9CLOT|nr:gamma carbonic anhydrase family protein [Clostridium zeae]GFZ31545.1 gamma carbonic anhydrase family protein [Clostridium zeae]
MEYSFDKVYPKVHNEAYIADTVDIIGKVDIQKDVSVWFGTVIRGDINSISIDEGSNIQDNSTVHVDTNNPVIIGKNVTIGHNSIIHGCTIGNNVLIGMGSIILNGATIGENTIIGAGSIVTENKNIPSGVLCFGSPAKVIRELSEEEIKNVGASAERYIKLSKKYK